MTVTEILIAVARHKPMTPPTLYRHLRKLKLKPLGTRQCPQHYPEDSAERILKHLGFKSSHRRQIAA
jgi:hypothetical protein